MYDTLTEHIVDGINVKVFSLPSGSFCALIVSNDVVFQATIDTFLKPVSVVIEHTKPWEWHKLPTEAPTAEMLAVMKLAALEHMNVHLATG